MSFLNLASQRKSTRSYSAKPVSRDIVEKCIEAARVAPSACNSQPWYFIIVDNPQLKDKLANAAFSGIYSMNNFAKQAPVLVVVVRKFTKYAALVGGFLRGVQYSLIDIGIAVEHFLLQAQEEGVGSCWIGWFNEKKVKKLLGVARGEKIDVIISLGYPREIIISDKKRKPKEEIREYR